MIEVCNFKRKTTGDACICGKTTSTMDDGPMECCGEMNCIDYLTYYYEEMEP